MKLIKIISSRWHQNDWTPPLPNLDYHLKHMGGGCLLVLGLVSFGIEWQTAAIAVAILFTVVEGATAAIVHNYSDCAFDWIQYQFHWTFYFIHYGLTIFAGLYFVLWLVAYFYALVEYW